MGRSICVWFNDTEILSVTLSPGPCADPVKILHALCMDLGSSLGLVTY